MLLIIIPSSPSPAVRVALPGLEHQGRVRSRLAPLDAARGADLVGPLVIVIALGALTWISTHTPRPLPSPSRLDADRPLPAGVKPLTVEVVALDWKWLFFYPDQGIATVNELAAGPVDRPISFKITSATVMNSSFIPALAGQSTPCPHGDEAPRG